MEYRSTRGRSPHVDAATAVLEGLAPDGGLYIMDTVPKLDLPACLTLSAQELAVKILTALLPDIDGMETLVGRAYRGKFQTEELAPTVPVGPFSVLELFRGPTSAFKDVALCMLPQLLTAARTQKGMKEEIRILTATSGDTGKAALSGFADVPGVSICVFYPQGGVSAIQRLQMTTQEGANVRVCAVEGDFDDAQTGVKKIFAQAKHSGGVRLSSANSINIGRLAPQITYYFTAYRDLLRQGKIRMGDEVNFSVPTGNFGDILAGYLAKQMGLPVGRLLCASNANCVLADFIRTGTYDRRRALEKTHSPSMDILVSSNLERLLYLLSGEDAQLVSSLMERLDREGCYTVPQSLLAKIREQFWADWQGDAATEAVIGQVWREHSYLCDPHTAVAWGVARNYREQTGDPRPMVVLSTASAYKFPETVLRTLGEKIPADGFDQIRALQALTGVPAPGNLLALEHKPELHPDVIAKDKMLSYAMEGL